MGGAGTEMDRQTCGEWTGPEGGMDQSTRHQPREGAGVAAESRSPWETRRLSWRRRERSSMLLIMRSRSLKMRTRIFAVIKRAAPFHCEVDGLVDTDIFEE